MSTFPWPRALRMLLPLFGLLALMVMPQASAEAQARSAFYGAPGLDLYGGYPQAERRVVQPRKVKISRKVQQRRLAYQRHVVQQRQIARKRHLVGRSTEARRVQAYRSQHSGSPIDVRSYAEPELAIRRIAPTRSKLAKQRLLRQSRLVRQETIRDEGSRRVASLGDVDQYRAQRQNAGRVEAHVDIRSQRMVVTVDGEVRHVWRVSTGKTGYATPRGVYGPKRMHASYFSRKYYNAPMPYAIFFKGGYAVHGTNDLKRLGGPASHGCVRLATGNARQLFHLVKQTGPGRARIVIT